jgi:chromosome segregation ATPase
MASLMDADPFAKIKTMIQEMIEKLVAEAEKEAEHKAYCDKEMGETKVKKEDKTEEVEDLQVKIDKATSKIAKLKQDINTLMQELAKIAEEQQTADKIRAEEKGAWESAEADFSSGLEGVGMALQVLRDYYAEKEESLLQTGAHTHAKVQTRQRTRATKETGAASGIIGMLEVVESDFSKLLAEGKAAEEQAIKIYEEQTTENKIATKTKETEIKYKTKDQKETESLLESLKEDIGGTQKELDAINQYWEKLQPVCVAKPEPYEERKKRREAEIAGLKEALKILEEESAPAFLQIRSRRA